MQKVTVQDQLVQKTEWKQMDGLMVTGDCITSLANAVGKNVIFRSSPER